MLSIENLEVKIEDKTIIKDLSMKIEEGEVHVIMGPNGSGKSTLSKVIAGHPDYEVTSGKIEYKINGEYKNLLDLEVDERVKEGVFLSFQYPVEVAGVTNIEFLRASFNSICKHQGIAEMDAIDFNDFVKTKTEQLNFNDELLDRQLNVELSGGEKKKNEILQMSILSPKIAFLDEVDSGLDIDSLKTTAEGIKKIKKEKTSLVLITHYQRLLDYILPDKIHVFKNGKILRSGDKSLALEIEEKGYDWIS